MQCKKLRTKCVEKEEGGGGKGGNGVEEAAKAATGGVSMAPWQLSLVWAKKMITCS